MVVANRDRVGQALDLLRRGLWPFVEKQMRAFYGEKWVPTALKAFKTPPASAQTPEKWDAPALLSVVDQHWNDVFKKILGKNDRTMVFEILEVRNRWAHQEPFNLDDTNRALDSIKRLLQSVTAREADEVDGFLQEVLRQKFEEMQKRERKRAAQLSFSGQPDASLLPWREIVTPHPDVTKGTFQQAEFAADLAQVHRGGAAKEYGDPQEFYRRTYVTDGLRVLLKGALLRLSGKGGDPVVQLQTNFGGGKTHSMLALYHLFSGTSAANLPGLEPILREAGLTAVPKARRAVFVGVARGPAQTHECEDGTVVRTTWGDIAWQLAGKEGYKLVADADKKGVSPGSDRIRELFLKAGPCLVLIDEWLTHLRQLYTVTDLPAGSFDANISFAQALTEAARAVPTALVVASLPSSDIEIGGEGGKEALTRLKNTFGRLEASWRPANQQESYEIVRRRLFQPVPAEKAPARDAVARAFTDYYREHRGEFPAHCGEAEYERAIGNSYPIHPELFERLYTDWASLERFQLTRGVLRLLASVIHELWVREDRNLLILPATVPVDARPVQDELRRYIEDTWGPVVEKDIDGQDSLALRLDQENPNLGRCSACRRVARTLFLGSAPTHNTAQKGLDDLKIKLGCAQPGESVAIFGDALRRLRDNATHLYEDGSRYWFDTQQSVNRVAKDRAKKLKRGDVLEFLTQRLRLEQSQRGDFDKVHTCPANPAEVPDEMSARLVILDPEHLHQAKAKDSPAMKQAQATLDQRGNAQRIYRNSLVFLAADQRRFEELEDAVRELMAWKSVDEEAEEMNLDAFQRKQAGAKKSSAEETVKQRIPEAYCWLLEPKQEDPKGDLEWREYRLQGSDRLAVRASRKLVAEQGLVTKWGGTLLRMEMDKVPLWRGNHVSIRQLTEDFAQYAYLQRLASPEVLVEAVRDGTSRFSWAEETFAYADDFIAKTGKYVGLRAGESVLVSSGGTGLVVRPEVAQEHRKAKDLVPGDSGGRTGKTDGKTTGDTGPAVKALPTRFHGAVQLNSQRLIRHAGDVVEAVVQQLQDVPGAEVEVTLQVQVRVPGGIPEAKQRTVSENCRTLRFASHEFESD